eukprot:4675749-Pyramimonas_sp.AAC.1
MSKRSEAMRVENERVKRQTEERLARRREKVRNHLERSSDRQCLHGGSNAVALEWRERSGVGNCTSLKR